MSRFFIFFIALLLPTVIFAQEERRDSSKLKMEVGHEMSLLLASKIELPQLRPDESEEDKWTRGTLLQLGFSQLSLTNWSSGGKNNIAFNAFVDVYRNLDVLDDMYWENRLQIGYGFIQTFGEKLQKSDDKFIFDSKLGYRAINNFFAAASFNMRTQLTNGFHYPSNEDLVLVSKPFGPAYFSLGVGIDYRPVKPLSINFSPLTGNLVIVDKRSLRTRYGNRIDQAAKLELGAQLKFVYKHVISKSLTINSTLNFFSDYLGKPLNIKTYWDLSIDTKINKYFSTTLRTNFIYDDEIQIANNEGELAPRVQFKEIFTVGFSYIFGDYKKP